MLFKFVEDSLKLLGVKKIITGTKRHLDLSPIFQRLGYEETRAAVHQVDRRMKHSLRYCEEWADIRSKPGRCSVGVAAAVVVGGVVGSALSSDSPDVPDPNPGQIASAQSSERVGLEMAAISRERLQWEQGRAAATDPIIKDVVAQQMRVGAKQEALTEDYTNYMKETFRPVERGVVKRALEYNLPEEQERMAGRARGEVAAQFDVQRGVMQRELSRYGFDPERFAAINASLAGQEAATSAGAANTARDTARTYGHALEMDAASLGRDLPSAQATSAGITLGAGNAAANNQLAGDRTAIASNQAALPWMQGANTAFGTAGAGYGNEYDARMSGYGASMNAASRNQAAMWGAGGAIAGNVDWSGVIKQLQQ